LQIKTKIVSTHTADSKPVKQDANGTVTLHHLVFPDYLKIHNISFLCKKLTIFSTGLGREPPLMLRFSSGSLSSAYLKISRICSTVASYFALFLSNKEIPCKMDGGIGQWQILFGRDQSLEIFG
jgi:hypothetical protein